MTAAITGILNKEETLQSLVMHQASLSGVNNSKTASTAKEHSNSTIHHNSRFYSNHPALNMPVASHQETSTNSSNTMEQQFGYTNSSFAKPTPSSSRGESHPYYHDSYHGDKANRCESIQTRSSQDASSYYQSPPEEIYPAPGEKHIPSATTAQQTHARSLSKEFIEAYGKQRGQLTPAVIHIPRRSQPEVDSPIYLENSAALTNNESLPPNEGECKPGNDFSELEYAKISILYMISNLV
jgi:hypothetical protein